MSLNSPSEMYFAVIEAAPKQGTDAFERYDGAHIACWINSLDLPKAREKAIALVERSGWFVKGVKEEKTIRAADYAPTNDGLERFHQALTDGEVCVIYTFPRNR